MHLSLFIFNEGSTPLTPQNDENSQKGSQLGL
jgi:hypothetical protein